MKNLVRAFLFSVILAFITLFSVSLLWKIPFTLAGLLIVLSVLMFLVWRDKEDLWLYAIVAICGALAESFAIGFGALAYSLPDFKDIPIWLPFLWGIMGVFIKKISLEIHKFRKKHNDL